MQKVVYIHGLKLTFQELISPILFALLLNAQFRFQFHSLVDCLIDLTAHFPLNIIFNLILFDLDILLKRKGRILEKRF
jgi:hypothetical protein